MVAIGRRNKQRLPGLDFTVFPYRLPKMVSGTRPRSNNRNRSRGQISKPEINAGTGLSEKVTTQKPRKCQTRTLICIWG